MNPTDLLPRDDWALFLDFDGTLVDIARVPGAIVVPPGLTATLEAVRRRLGGALAIVTGRPIADIDRYLAPLELPCAGEHGAVVRFADGALRVPDKDHSVPAAWRDRIRAATAGCAGVLVQDKAFSLAVHYRQAPERGDELRTLLTAIVAEKPEFEAMPARMAFEIRHRSLNKGEGVRALMGSAPFAGRVPVSVGDDVTDEDAFRAARAMGGLGLHVAVEFGGQPDNVRRWLAGFAAGT